MNKDEDKNENKDQFIAVVDSCYKVEIDAKSQIDVKEGVSDRTKKPYKMVKQEAYLHQKNRKYPTRIFVPLHESNKYSSYPPGFYRFGNLLSIGQYDDVMISRDIVLVPISK